MIAVGVSLRRPLLVVLSLGGIAAAAALPTGAKEVRQVVVPVVAPTPSPAPTPTPVPVFAPDTIAIPALGVEAPVVPVGTEADGAMGTPSNGRDVAWWQHRHVGSGNALFAGHRDWNRSPGSFFALGDLSTGDEVVVSGEGAALTFRVEWVRQMPGDAEAAEILGDQGGPVLTLITCAGAFDRSIRHYTDRVVVRAVLA